MVYRMPLEMTNGVLHCQSPLNAESVVTSVFHKLLGTTFWCLRLQYLGGGVTQVSADVQARIPAKFYGGDSHYMRVSQTGLFFQ